MRNSLAEMLSNRSHYSYNYWDYVCAHFTCCFTRWTKCRSSSHRRRFHDESVRRLMQELDIVAFVRDQRLSSFAHKLTMNGHQRWFVNKFQKYNLATEDQEKMEEIKRTEEKEARRT